MLWVIQVLVLGHGEIDMNIVVWILFISMNCFCFMDYLFNLVLNCLIEWSPIELYLPILNELEREMELLIIEMCKYMHLGSRGLISGLLTSGLLFLLQYVVSWNEKKLGLFFEIEKTRNFESKNDKVINLKNRCFFLFLLRFWCNISCCKCKWYWCCRWFT